MRFPLNFLTKKAPLISGALVLLLAFIIPDVASAQFDQIGASFMGWLQEGVYWLAFVAFSITGWLAGVAGAMLNWVVVAFVFQFAVNLGNSPGMLTAWGILRDFGNMALLFGFIFMGIATILNLHDYPVKKTIPKLIIYAVLLNFSLFTAELVIDVSNVFATQFYKAAAAPCVNEVSNIQDDFVKCAIDNGISGSIMSVSGISQVFALGGDGTTGAADTLKVRAGNDTIRAMFVLFVLSVFLLSIFAVFIGATVLLITRAVMLAFLMVTSPIGFAGMAIPPLEEMARKWWKHLLSQAYFAPVFFLLLFIGLNIINGAKSLITKNSPDTSIVEALVSNDVSMMAIIIFFGLSIGFMVAALMMAKQFGIGGAEAVTGWATKLIGNTAAGVPAGLLRFGVGAPSNLASRVIRRSGIGGIPLLGRTLSGVADAGAKASFDVRQITPFGDLLGKPDKAGGAEGHRGVDEARKQKILDHDESLEKADSVEYKRWELEFAPQRERMNERLGAIDRQIQSELSNGTPNWATINALEQEKDNVRREYDNVKAKRKMDRTIKGMEESAKQFQTRANELQTRAGQLQTQSASIAGQIQTNNDRLAALPALIAAAVAAGANDRILALQEEQARLNAAAPGLQARQVQINDQLAITAAALTQASENYNHADHAAHARADRYLANMQALARVGVMAGPIHSAIVERRKHHSMTDDQKNWHDLIHAVQSGAHAGGGGGGAPKKGGGGHP